MTLQADASAHADADGDDMGGGGVLCKPMGECILRMRGHGRERSAQTEAQETLGARDTDS